MTGLTPLRHVLGSCDHADAILSRNAGNNAIGFWCDNCRSWITKPQVGKLWIPKDHPSLRGKDLPNLPTVGEKIYRMCQGVCKQIGHCQLHHIAPRAFFGDECDEWPMVWLCVSCHARWHQIVTPGLCTAYDADAHATSLIDYLDLDRAASLTRALTRVGKARRAGAA